MDNPVESNNPPEIEWPSKWKMHAVPFVRSQYEDCEYQCDHGWLLSTNETAGKCPYCLDSTQLN